MASGLLGKLLILVVALAVGFAGFKFIKIPSEGIVIETIMSLLRYVVIFSMMILMWNFQTILEWLTRRKETTSK